MDLRFSEQLFRVIFSTFCGQRKYFLKKYNFFLPTKSWKNHPQKLLRKTQIHFFPLTAFLCNFLVRLLRNFLKIFFCPQKVEKTTLKSCSEFLKSTFFPLLPAQPKWPKQKKSCSKMWPIDQLYSSVPNRRVRRNKRAGGKILRKH